MKKFNDYVEMEHVEMVKYINEKEVEKAIQAATSSGQSDGMTKMFMVLGLLALVGVTAAVTAVHETKKKAAEEEKQKEVNA